MSLRLRRLATRVQSRVVGLRQWLVTEHRNLSLRRSRTPRFRTSSAGSLRSPTTRSRPLLRPNLWCRQRSTHGPSGSRSLLSLTRRRTLLSFAEIWSYSSRSLFHLAATVQWRFRAYPLEGLLPMGTPPGYHNSCSPESLQQSTAGRLTFPRPSTTLLLKMSASPFRSSGHTTTSRTLPVQPPLGVPPMPISGKSRLSLWRPFPLRSPLESLPGR
jgi:hypothetical protein